MLYLCAHGIHLLIAMNQNDNTQYPVGYDPPSEGVSVSLKDNLMSE
jgi:hypothetical protein